MHYNLLCILGATASGKTSVAVQVAKELNGEIISADSRQVYTGMDIGTGKDLNEYDNIPFHLIDILPAGAKYSVFEFQKDFEKALQLVQQQGNTPILCGGSGLYLEAVLNSYQMQAVPPNIELREQLERYSHEELVALLKSYKKLHNTTDSDTKKRTIRAIEIEEYCQKHPLQKTNSPQLKPLIIGIENSVEERRKRITKRLHKRLEEGMIEEVKTLLDSGITPEDLLYYGLEYKYLTLYLTHV